MISLDNIHKYYMLGKTKIHALKGVDLTINKGDFACIMGPSGSGKSTILNLIGCMDQPDEGDLNIDNIRINHLSKDQLAEIRSEKIGFIFQNFNLIPVLNVYENVEFPLFISKQKLSAAEKKERILNLLKTVGLEDFAKHRPDELSGGQRQRVAIARAFVSKPNIILADEPTANLDSKTGTRILETMKELNEKEKITFLFSTHDQKVQSFANKVFNLCDGKIDNGN